MRHPERGVRRFKQVPLDLSHLARFENWGGKNRHGTDPYLRTLLSRPATVSSTDFRNPRRTDIRTGVVPTVLRAMLRTAGGLKRSVAVLLALGTPISSRGCFSPEPSEPGPGPRHFGIG